MSADDRKSYFDGKDDYDDEEDLFKKYSLRDQSDPEDNEDDDEYKNGLETDGYYDDEEQEGPLEDNKLEDEFFTDSDFEFRDSSGEEDDGFRSTKIREKRRKRKLWISTFLIMSVLVLVAIGIVFGYRFIKNKYFSDSNQAAETQQEAIVVPASMKLGRDLSIVISCTDDNLLEPTINSIIFSKYTSSKSELVSLCMPVNTLFEIPGFGLDSLSRAVEFGGPDLLKLTIKDNTGVDAGNYLLLDVVNVVNKLESIKLELDQAVTFPSGTGSDIELKQGENILNGETTRSFLEYYNGTYSAVGVSGIKQHKAVLDSIMKKIVGTEEGDLAKNLTKINDYIDTDLNLEELSELISTVSSLSAENNKIYSLDGRVEPIDEAGTVVFVPDISRIADIFSEQEVTQETVIEEMIGEKVSVTVLNGVGVQGIATKTSDFLKGLKFSDGSSRFEVPTVGDADNYDYAETQILVNTQDEVILNSAEQLRATLLAGNVVVQEGTEQATDIILIIGRDFDYEGAVAINEQAAEPQTQETEPQAPIEGQVYDVNILNGEGTQGIAATAKGILEDNLNKDSKTINIKETKNADGFDYEVTKILVHTDKEGVSAMAENIKQALGVGTISESADNPDSVDITVIIGSDYTKQ